MDRIGKLAKPGTSGAVRPSSPSPEELRRKAKISQIFEILRRRYGALWIQQIGETEEAISGTLDEWYRALSSKSDEDLRRGLESWKSNFPPNAMEFMKACRDPRARPEHQHYQKIPILGPDREAGIAKVRELKDLARKATIKMTKEKYRE